MDNCPNCKVSLLAGDVYDSLLITYPEKDKALIYEWAFNFGWTPQNKKQFKREIAIVSWEKDRTLCYKCPDCSYEWK